MTRWLPLLLLLVFILLWLGRPRRVTPRAQSADGAPWNPHAVLGVPPGASPDLVIHAYRERLKEYHPDRVAGLGPELQELAHRKTLDIQRAYDELTRL